MTTYILGAGPTGMAIADGVVDTDAADFVVLEKSRFLGGLAQTVRWEGVGDHDLGPHKIFTLDENLKSRIEALIPEADWLIRDKVSSIYINGHYLPYPPSPFLLGNVFGVSIFVKMLLGYAVARIKNFLNARKPTTFEEDLIGRLGVPLYEILFKPITEKLWGNPKKLDAKLSKGRVQTPSLIEVLSRLLKIQKSSEFEALSFRYPKGGLSRLWRAIEAKSEGKGEFCLGYTVTGLDVEQNQIVRIRYQANEVDGVIDIRPDDYVVSTLPLAKIICILTGALPAHFPRLANKVVELNDLFLVFFHIDKPSLIKESWVFVPDPGIIFHRLSEQESFDPEMTPNGSIVCCEVMSNSNRQLGKMSDNELYLEVRRGLFDMGYTDFEILHRRVIRLHKSYPVFHAGYETGLAELLKRLDNFQNFRSIGRQGAFNYIGTLDAMDIGYGFSEWLAEKSNDSWLMERERTSHYPVLD